MSSRNNPLITIITAVFNAEQLLEKTINCVINQTYKNIEYIVIDGGSTDKTVDILRRYESQINYWVSETDNGIYEAWNKGIQASRGEWIAFLGAGDVYRHDAISTKVNSLLELEITPDLVSSRIHLINSDNKILRVWGKPFAWNEFRKAMKFAHVGALHHRSLFERHGFFDTSYKSAGDYDFFMRCGEGLRTVFIDKVTADVLVGGISMDSSIALQETCCIQKKYGMNPLLADYYFFIAHLKQKLRPSLRGY